MITFNNEPKTNKFYEWGVENLLDKETGKIADSRHGNGNPAWKAHVYNQATFIGASILLYKATGEKRYLDNAILAADYTVKDMSAEHKVLPFESGIEQGIYTAIFAEYMAWLVYDCGQTQYLPFLKHTIKTGWANRDETRNVCGAWLYSVLYFPTNEPSVRKRNKIPGTLAHIVPSRVTLMEKTFGSWLPSKGMVLICWVDLSKVYNPFVVPNHIFFSWSSAM